MTGRLLVAAAALLLRAVAQLRGTSPRHTIALPNESDARQLPEDCEAISWADLCERQLSSGECFQLQPGTTSAGCRLQGPSMALAPAQLQGAAPGVVTTCGTGGELRIIGQIQVISLRLDAETIVFEDAQVEAWHEAPDLSIEAGGAFHSKGPLTLTRSNLTVRGTGAVKGGALAAGDLTLVSSSLRVLNAAAADSGGGFYGEGTLRLRQLSKVLIENVSAHKGNGAGFFVTRDADVSDSGLIDIKNARFAKIGGGFFVKQRLQLTNHSTVRIRHATAAGLGGGFATLDEVVIAGMSNVSISDAVATGGGGFYADKRLQMTSNSTLNLQNVKAGKHGGGVLSLGEVEIRESSTVMICNSHAVSGSGGGFVTDDQLNVSNGSTLIILNATAGKEGGGFFAGGKVEIGGSSTVRISNTHAVSGDGGGFLALNELKVSNGSSLIILNATAGSRGRGLFADGKVAIDNSAVSIQQATAAEFGGGALVFDEVVIAGMSNVSISDTVATEQGGGFAVQKRLKVTNNSTLNLQNVKAGRNGGGLFALAEVDIDGSSTVKVSNSQAHSGDGGGLLIEKGLNISSGSTLIILNATAASHGGGFWVGGEMLALSNSTVSVQHATAGKWGGGFLASDQVVIAAGSTVSISDAVAAESGGGFQVRKHLQVMCKSTLNIQNVKAGDSGGGFNAEGQVEVRESSIVKISNSHAVSASGGGFHTNELNIFNRSVLIILNATAGSSGGGFHSSGKAAVFSSSTISIQHTRAGLFGGGFIAVDKVVIAGRSTVSIFDAVAADQGGGFQVEKHLQVTSHSTLNLQDVKAGKHGGGFHAFQEVEIAGSSTVKISNSQAVSESGGGFDAIELNIFNRSALIILNATAGRYGGAFVCEHRVSMRSSTVHIQHTKAGSGGGGLYAIGEVDIGGSSTVKISNSHTVSGYGGGLYAKKELKVSNRSALMILNATAPGNGGGFYAGGKVAISSSTVSIQRARAGKLGGGFCAEGSIALSDASTVAMSDTHAGVDGGGFMVATALATHNSSMSTANSTAERTGTAGRVDGQVLLSSQSSLDIHHAEGDANSAVLAASCLQLHPESSLFLEGIIGRHGLYLQNSCSSSLCSNTTFHVAEGAALDATGRLSSGLLSVNACPHEEVRLSGIHLRSWNSSLLTTRPRYVVVDNVNIHYLPPVDHLQVLAAQENFSIDSLAISCPDCPQGVTFNATEDGTLQALSPENLHCSKAFTVSNGFTPRCACSDYQITSEHFRNTELVSLEDVFRTCRFCNRHSYFQDGSCRPCEIYRAWSDGKRDVCHVLPHESPERVILFMGAAVFVILTFIAFEILHAPLVILDAKSDIEDPSEVAAKRIFTVSVKGPITSLPTSISRLLHQRVRYRARGTGLQWLDFDPQKSKAIKVCSVAQKKFLLQDAHVPFDCASCRGSLHATETCVMVTLLIALLFLLAILPTIIKVAVVSGNGLQHTFVTSVFYIALPMAAVAAVLHWPVAWLIQGLYRRTPFSEALDDYRKQIHCKPHPGPDATHPRNQGLLVLTLRGLWKHFESFILERNMHFVVANIVRPLTQSKGVSFVTLWGGRQVDYFVSHSWGTSFSHFVQSIRCHALSKEGSASWIDAAYWICSFANNQWNIAAELADDPMDSAFARALRGGIKGVAMVLDQEVQPLTRVWCLFEFLLSSREQLELVFTTDLGVVGDDGCASFDIALEVGNKIECLEVAKCQASSDEDKRKIFEYIINTLGSLESMDGRIKHLMGQMLKKNLANVGSATDSLLHRLGQS